MLSVCEAQREYGLPNSFAYLIMVSTILNFSIANTA